MNINVLQLEISISKACKDILDNTISRLFDEFSKKNILDLTDDDLNLVKKYPYIWEKLEKE